MKIFLVFVLFSLYGLCIPLYRKLNPSGFRFYLGYCMIIGLLWLLFVFGTNIF